MKRSCLVFARKWLVTWAIVCLIGGVGCETNEDYLDHKPPAGMGSLVVDNQTGDDIEVFVDGRLDRTVDDYGNATVDLKPGQYRVVVLEKEDSDRSGVADVDILSGRLAILRVSWTGTNALAYSIVLSYHTP